MGSQNLIQAVLVVFAISIVVLVMLWPVLSGILKKIRILFPPRYLKYRGIRYKSQEKNEQ